MTTQNKLKVWQQVDNLGIDRNLLYEIVGGLDNIDLLGDFISEIMEDYDTPDKIKKISQCRIEFDMKKVMGLSFIIDNEIRNTRKAINTLIEQIEHS